MVTQIALDLTLLLERRIIWVLTKSSILQKLGKPLKMHLQQLEFHVRKLIDIQLLPGGEMMLILFKLESIVFNLIVLQVKWTHLLIL